MNSTLTQQRRYDQAYSLKTWCFICVNTHALLPDIERDGHHSIEDDDVGPEREEGRERSFVAVLPRQEDHELSAFVHLPEPVPYGQDGAHEGQNTKDLQGEDGETQMEVKLSKYIHSSKRTDSFL